MKQPYVICHMGSTIDGRIISEHWGKDREKFSALYEDCHNSFNSQAWLVGRVTMEKDFTEGRVPDLTTPDKPISRKPFIGDIKATSFAIAIDQSGKLGWDSGEIDGDHVITVLTEGVTDAYLHHLQRKGVSYIFAGKTELDLPKALEQLGALFPIKTLMLEGGGHLNGSMLAAGLVDEISLLVLPLADGLAGTATSFEADERLAQKTAQSLQLLDCKKLEHDVIWLRYAKNQ